MFTINKIKLGVGEELIYVAAYLMNSRFIPDPSSVPSPFQREREPLMHKLVALTKAKDRLVLIQWRVIL
uniref:Uncharacterized protein n=1 Tax=Amphimedon queenslandica TaxID=400682 RepID=A0A1X7SGT6_AMPQE